MIRDSAHTHTVRTSCCHASCAKMFATEMCGRVADRCLQIHGGAAISVNIHERFYRDVRLFRLYEGTTQIQQIIIAREMIKQATLKQQILEYWKY